MKDIVATNKTEQLELLMAEEDDRSVECPLEHRFSDGVYVREITMPTNSYILGHKHSTTHMNIISKGSCLLADIDTGEITHIEAPYTFESKAGVQKLLYILTDCVWSTVHVTNETDIDILEKQLIIPSRICKELRNEDEYIRR